MQRSKEPKGGGESEADGQEKMEGELSGSRKQRTCRKGSWEPTASLHSVWQEAGRPCWDGVDSVSQWNGVSLEALCC